MDLSMDTLLKLGFHIELLRMRLYVNDMVMRKTKDFDSNAIFRKSRIQLLSRVRQFENEVAAKIKV